MNVHLLGHECLNRTLSIVLHVKKIFLKDILRRALLGRYCAELDERELY